MHNICVQEIFHIFYDVWKTTAYLLSFSCQSTEGADTNIFIFFTLSRCCVVCWGRTLWASLAWDHLCGLLSLPCQWKADVLFHFLSRCELFEQSSSAAAVHHLVDTQSLCRVFLYTSVPKGFNYIIYRIYTLCIYIYIIYREFNR